MEVVVRLHRAGSTVDSGHITQVLSVSQHPRVCQPLAAHLKLAEASRELGGALSMNLVPEVARVVHKVRS